MTAKLWLDLTVAMLVLNGHLLEHEIDAFMLEFYDMPAAESAQEALGQLREAIQKVRGGGLVLGDSPD